MMQIPGACSVAAGTPVVSVLGHKWSQLIGPRYLAAGWIGPELRPCSAADMPWEETPAGPVGAGRSPRPGRRARQAGCRFPVSGRAAEPMRTPSKRAPYRSESAAPSATSRIPANFQSASHWVIERFWRTRADPIWAAAPSSAMAAYVAQNLCYDASSSGDNPPRALPTPFRLSRDLRT